MAQKVNRRRCEPEEDATRKGFESANEDLYKSLVVYFSAQYMLATNGLVLCRHTVRPEKQQTAMVTLGVAWLWC